MINPLPLLPVAPSFFAWQGHQIAHYRHGSGPPVLLIHSINAAASVFEMRAPFQHLSDQFTTHAVDLLGYGNSDRPARAYLAADYISLIIATLEQIGQPTDVIASSLGAAYALAAASERPDLFRRLIAVCPVGLDQLAEPPGRLAFSIHRLLFGPLGKLLFKFVAGPRSTRYFLEKQTYSNPRLVDKITYEGFYRTSSQPNAFYAPICFLTGLLNCDLHADLPKLRVPTTLVWGDKAKITMPYRAKAFLRLNPRLASVIIANSGMLVQDEQPVEFANLVRQLFSR